MITRAGHFDRTVWLVCLGVLLAIGLVIERGDRLGLQVAALSPIAAATSVSTRTQLQIRFDQMLSSDIHAIHLSLNPPMSGTVHIVGDTVIFVPAVAWQSKTMYTATLAAGLQSQPGRRLRNAVTWHFQTGQPRVLYAASDTFSRTQLYVTTAALGLDTANTTRAQPQQLTFGPISIWDFAVAPDGLVMYSIVEENGMGNLWTIRPGIDKVNLLVGCPNAVCNDASPSPSGHWLAYSKRNASLVSSGVMSPPRLWLLDLQTGQTKRVLTDEQRLSFLPRWSSDEEWLSYLAPDLGGVGVHNLVTGEEHLYPTTAGETGLWRPGHLQLLVTVTQPVGERIGMHLVLIEVATGDQHNLSGATTAVEDGTPAWSPNGEWIAFGRKELTGPQATLGQQLWRMRADGSAAEALTHDPGVDHGFPTWSPDGRYVLFSKLQLHGGNSSIWLYDVQTSQQWVVANAGQRPLWIP